MKLYLVLFFILINIQPTKAQVCGLSQSPSLTMVYLFTERTDLSLQQIFGEPILPGMVNIIRINSQEEKQNIDNMVLSGKAEGIFIFPGDIEIETRRFCSAKDYLSTLGKSIKNNH